MTGGRRSGLFAAALALASIASANAAPGPCPIANADLLPGLRELPGRAAAISNARTDARSGEPVLRHVADFASGATIVVEQQNCQIYNLRITLLSPAQLPNATELRTLGQALALTPLFRRHFRQLDPGALLTRELASPRFVAARAAQSQFTYGWDDIPAVSEQSEAVLSFMSGTSDVAPYRSALTVYVSVRE